MREVDPSKNLLLHAVMRDANSANNGGLSFIFWSVDSHNRCGPSIVVQLLEDQKLIKTIPWEVNLKLI